MLLFLLSLFACGEDESTDSADSSSVEPEASEEIAANFYCG